MAASSSAAPTEGLDPSTLPGNFRNFTYPQLVSYLCQSYRMSRNEANAYIKKHGLYISKKVQKSSGATSSQEPLPSGLNVPFPQAQSQASTYSSESIPPLERIPEEDRFSDPFGARVQPPGTPPEQTTRHDISTPIPGESVEPRSAVASGPSLSAKREQKFDDLFVRADAAAAAGAKESLEVALDRVLNIMTDTLTKVNRYTNTTMIPGFKKALEASAPTVKTLKLRGKSISVRTVNFVIEHPEIIMGLVYGYAFYQPTFRGFAEKYDITMAEFLAKHTAFEKSYESFQEIQRWKILFFTVLQVLQYHMEEVL